MKAKAEREAKVEKIKEDLARLEEWLCPICCASNSGLTHTCENVVKTGGKLVSAMWCFAVRIPPPNPPPTGCLHRRGGLPPPPSLSLVPFPLCLFPVAILTWFLVTVTRTRCCRGLFIHQVYCSCTSIRHRGGTF